VKKFIIIFFTIFALFTGAWFLVANIAEKKIHSEIEDLKSSGIIKSYSGNIHITGYPFKFVINVEYPNLQLSPKDHIADYNMLYDGSIKIILGLFSDAIKIKTDGNMHLKGHINSKNFHIISSGGNSNYTIGLQNFLISPSFIYNIINTKKTQQDSLFDIIKSVNIETRNLKLINKINNEIVANIEASDIGFDIDHSDNYYIDYKEKNVNTEFGREAIVLWNSVQAVPALAKAVNKIPYNVRAYFAAFRPDKLGKLNYDIKLKAELGKDILILEVDRFLLKDNVEDIYLEGTFKQYKYRVYIDASSKMTFKSQWYYLMRTYVNSADFDDFNARFFSNTSKNSIISSIVGPIDSFLNIIFQKKQSNTKDAYIPKLHEMGNITLKVKTNYEIASNSDFDLEIDNFFLSSTPFDIKASGNVQNKNSQDQYKLEISIRNYPNLVDIASNYVNRIAKTTKHTFFISGKHFEITNRTSAKIKSLIKKLSNENKNPSENAEITAKKTKNNEYPAIGKYSSKEFAFIWASFIAELLAEKIQDSINDFVTNLHKNETISDVSKTVTDAVSGLVQNVFR